MQPGPYSNYPRPPIQEINFAVISEGWKVVTKNIGPFALAGVLMVLAYLAVTGLGFLLTMPLFAAANAASDSADPFASLSAQLVWQGAFTPFSILSMAVAAPFAMSITHMTLKVASGQALELGDAVYGTQRFGQAFVVGLIVGIGVTIGSICCYIPAFIVGGLTMFTYPIMLTRNLKPFEALRESWALLTRHLLMATLLYLVLSILSGLGICLCVGIVLTLPLLYVCPALVYRDFYATGQPDPAPVGAPSPAADF